MFAKGFTKISISKKFFDKYHAGFLSNKVQPALDKMDPFTRKAFEKSTPYEHYNARVMQDYEKLHDLDPKMPYKQKRRLMQQIAQDTRRQYSSVAPLKYKKPEIKGKKPWMKALKAAGLVGASYYAAKKLFGKSDTKPASENSPE